MKSVRRDVVYGQNIGIIISAVICASLVFSISVNAESYYNWTDEEGATHIGNEAGNDEPLRKDETKENVGSRPLAVTSDTSSFVVHSRQWLKPGIKDIGVTVEISNVKNNIYHVSTKSSRQIKPFSEVEPDDVLFFTFCVADYFASNKGFNGWTIKKKDQATKRSEMGYSIALTDVGSRISENKHNECSKFIKPEFLAKNTTSDKITITNNQKPVCGSLIEMMANYELMNHAHQKKYQPNQGTKFQFTFDINRDGKMDNVRESIIGSTIHLEVTCAGYPSYRNAQDADLTLLAIDGKEYALFTEVKWDKQKRRGTPTSRRLYELTCQGAKLVCDRQDMAVLLDLQSQQ